LESVKSDIDSQEILKKLEAIDSEREYVLKQSRSILVSFPKIFALLHDDKVADAKAVLKELRDRLSALESRTNYRWLKYVLPAQIECVEATALLSIIEGSIIPSQAKLGFEIEAYMLGMLDCIGELRRAVYEKINEQNYEKAFFFYSSMKAIFDSISPFSYFDNVIPSLRRKIDLARRLMDETYVDITKMNKLKM
jgi:translin